MPTAVALAVVKTLVLIVGGVITSFAYKAYRRTRQPALGYLTLGFGLVTLGLVLAGMRQNEERLAFLGYRVQVFKALVFSYAGMVAGLAGGLYAHHEGYIGPADLGIGLSTYAVLYGLFGGVGTLIGPVLGAGFIKYFENIFSKINDGILHSWFAFLPDGLENTLVALVHPFVGKGWHLTLGLLFMLVVIFLPGGLVEGGQRIGRLFRRRGRNAGGAEEEAARKQPAE